MNRKIYRSCILCIVMMIGIFNTVFAQLAETELTPVLTAELENVTDFSMANDNRRLLVAKSSGELSIWDMRVGEIILTLDTSALNVTLNSIAWSVDDRFIAGAFSDKGRIWDSQTGELMYELDDHPRQPILEDSSDGVDGIVFSPTEPLAATYQMFDQTVLLYDLQTQTIKYELSGNVPESYIMELAFSPDGSLLAVRQLTGGIAVWDTQTGKKLYRFLGEAMAFSPDSTLLITGLGRFVSELWVWDLSNGNQLYEMVAPLQVNQIQWSNDNQKIFGWFTGPPLSDGWIYNGEVIRSWNIKDTSHEIVFGVSENTTMPLALGDEQIIIGLGSYHLDGEVLIWDKDKADVFRQTFSPETPDQDYTVFVNPIYAFDINSRNDFLAAGHNEGITLWDAGNGNSLGAISTASRVRKLAFSSADDGLLVGLTNDNKLLIWLVNKQ